jgi:hypothetical protein
MFGKPELISRFASAFACHRSRSRSILRRVTRALRFLLLLCLSAFFDEARASRTYDSRDKRMGDFGVGWTLDIKNIRLQKNRNLGLGWEQTSTGGGFATYCLNPRKPRFVTITFPDGRAHKFQMTTLPDCQFGAPITGVIARVQNHPPLRRWFHNIWGFDFKLLTDSTVPLCCTEAAIRRIGLCGSAT